MIMNRLLSSLIVLIIITTSFISCDKLEEIQDDVCADEVNQRDLIEARISFKVNLVYSPIDNRKVKISFQKQYCDGHFPSPIVFEGNTTGAGFYSGQGFFKMENALDKIIVSISIEEETQDGKYYEGETTFYYDDFNPLLPVLTMKIKDDDVEVIQGWGNKEL